MGSDSSKSKAKENASASASSNLQRASNQWPADSSRPPSYSGVQQQNSFEIVTNPVPGHIYEYQVKPNGNIVLTTPIGNYPHGGPKGVPFAQPMPQKPSPPPRIQQPAPQIPPPVYQLPSPAPRMQPQVSQMPPPVRPQTVKPFPLKAPAPEVPQLRGSNTSNINAQLPQSTQVQNQKPPKITNNSPFVDPLTGRDIQIPNDQPITDQKQKIITLNLDDISSGLKDNKSSDFVELNKQLGKNKPLSDVRKSLVANKHLSDIRFIVGNETIFAHKLFVVTLSAQFYRHFHVNDHSEMKVKEGISRETFIEILNYCYTGQLKVTDENVSGLLIAAQSLEIQQILNMCSNFVDKKINPNTIFLIFDEAVKHNSKEYQDKCLEYIVKNEVKCFNSKGLFEISLPSLMKVIEACKFTTERSNEYIEKWTNGSAASLESVPVKPAGGAVKKAPQKSNKKPPQSLLDTPIGPPQLPPNVAQIYQSLKPIRPFADETENLISFDNDDDDDTSSIICKDESDDDLTSENNFGGSNDNTTLVIEGVTQQCKSDFSRIDLVCKKTVLIKEIWFKDNLFSSADFKSVKVSIVRNKGDKKMNMHNRVINNGTIAGMKLNFIKFYKRPLKLFGGQRFSIKLNFSESALRTHLHATNISPAGFIELRGDIKKSYFNCINKIVVSETT